MTSEIRANTLKNRVGLGTVSFTNTGPIVSGILTTTGDVYLGNDIYLTDGSGGYEQVEVSLNDIRVKHKHIHSEFGVWTRSTSVTDRKNGIESGGTDLRLYSNSTEKVRIDSSGNVIVNNNTAAAGSYTYKLLTSDNISSSEQTFGVQYPGVVTYGLNAESNADFTIKKDGAERLRISSSGVVYIGTTNATTIGTIDQNVIIGSTTNAEEVALTLNVMEGTNNRRVKFFLDDDDGVFGFDSTASTGVPPFVVRMASSEKLRIDQNGNITAQKSASFGNTSDSFTALTITSSTSGISELRFADTTANAGYVKYEHSSNNLILASNATPRMTIQSTGIVKVETSDSSGLNAHMLVNNSESSAGISLLGSGSSFSSGGWAAVTDAGIIRSSAGAANGLVLQAASGDLKFYAGGNPPAERFRIASDGTPAFFSPAVAWHEGPAILEASNGYAEIFFRSTGSTHGTSITGTWSIGKLAGTAGFGILKNGMTGGGAVRSDAPLSISNAGDITIGKQLLTPKRPAFFVTMNGGNQTTTAANRLPFDTVVHNEGSHYQTSGSNIYNFVCPVAGFYFFGAQVWLKHGSGTGNHARWEIWRDSTIVALAGWHQNGVNLTDMQSSATVTIYCDAGAKVYVEADYDLTYWRGNASQPHTFFHGFLIG